MAEEIYLNDCDFEVMFTYTRAHRDTQQFVDPIGR